MGMIELRSLSSKRLRIGLCCPVPYFNVVSLGCDEHAVRLLESSPELSGSLQLI